MFHCFLVEPIGLLFAVPMIGLLLFAVFDLAAVVQALPGRPVAPVAAGQVLFGRICGL